MALAVPQIYGAPDEIWVGQSTFTLGIKPTYADGDTKHPITFAWSVLKQDCIDGNVLACVPHATNEDVVQFTHPKQIGEFILQCIVSNQFGESFTRTKTVLVSGINKNYTSYMVRDNPQWLWDNGYTNFDNGQPSQSPFSKIKLTTTADKIVVKSYAGFGPSGGGYGEIGVIVDGVVQPTIINREGFEDTIVKLGTAGVTKQVEIIAARATAFTGTTPTGSYIERIKVPSGYTTTIQNPPSISNRLVVYGDSIQFAEGYRIKEDRFKLDGSGTEQVWHGDSRANSHYSWHQRLEREYGANVLVEAWGGRSLKYDAQTTTKRDAFVARLVSYQPSKMLWMIGTNDGGFVYEAGVWEISQFTTRYAETLDAIHAALPSLHIVCVSPVWRNIGVDSEMNPPYRNTIQTICSTRNWTTYIDGENLVDHNDISVTGNSDGLHPTGYGHNQMLPVFANALGYTSTLSAKKTYYVDATNGHDNDSGLSTSLPWKTIAKVNSSVASGDTVLFKRGETWYEKLVPISGIMNVPTKINAYGTGALPIISSGKLVTGWTSVGNGLYKKVLDGALTIETGISNPGVANPLRLQQVKLNNTIVERGGFPRRTDQESYTSGWLIPDAGSTGNTGVSSLFSGYNFVGAEIVSRTQEWERHIYDITAHTGNTITTTQAAFNGTVFPVRVINSPSLCTELGDWSYNTTTKELFMFFGNLNPETQKVEISVNNTNLSGTGKHNIEISNIRFEMANEDAILLENLAHIKFDSIEIADAGTVGVAAYYGCYLEITNSLIRNTNWNGLRANYVDYVTNTHNVYRDISLIDGADKVNFLSACGANTFEGDYPLHAHNEIHTVAYVALRYEGHNYAQVFKNKVYNFARRAYDGGGIYCHDLTWHYNAGYEGGQYSRRRTGCEVWNNLADNSMMFSRYNICGIYHDDGVTGATITDNVIRGVGAAFTQKTYNNMTFKRNIVYDCDRGGDFGFASREMGEPNVLNTTHTGNTYILKNPEDRFFMFGGIDFADTDISFYYPANTVEERIKHAGTINNNKYINAFGKGDIDIISTQYYRNNYGFTHQYLSPKGWGLKYEHDQNSLIRGIKPKLNITSYEVRTRYVPFNTSVPANTILNSEDYPEAIISWDANSPFSGGGGAAKLVWTNDNPLKHYEYNFVKIVGGNAAANGKTSIYRFKFYATSAVTLIFVGTEHEMGWSDTSHFDCVAGENIVEAQVTSKISNNGFSNFSMAVLDRAAGPFWIKELEEFNNATYVPYDPTQYMRSEVNPSDTPLVVSLDQPYLDVVDNTIYTGSITVPPRSARILMNDTGSIPSLPIVNAGSNQTLANGTTSVNLTGTATGETSVLWTRQSGPNIPTIVNATSKTTSVTGLVTGTYVFDLAATNTDGTSHSNVTIVVSAPVSAVPVVNAGNDQSLPSGTTTATLNATVSGATSYLWTKISGPNTPTITTPTTEDTTLTGMIAGTYRYRLTATNNTGSAFDELDIVIAQISLNNIILRGLKVKIT